MNSVLAPSILKCCAVYVFKGFKNLANCHKLKSFFVCLFVLLGIKRFQRIIQYQYLCFNFLDIKSFIKKKYILKELNIAKNGSRTLVPKENCPPSPPQPNRSPNPTPKPTQWAYFLRGNCPGTRKKSICRLKVHQITLKQIS